VAVIAWEFHTMVGYPMLVSDVDWDDLATQIIGDAVAEVSHGAEQVKVVNKVLEGNAA
jgi:hypothetical protein